VGLKDKHHSFPAELSAGEKQKAAIARAIVNRPAVILADEPTAALEKSSVGEILALLRRIHSEGAALLLVTTRHEVAEALPARVLRLEEGRIVAGDPGLPPVEVGPSAPWSLDALGWSPTETEGTDAPAAAGAPQDPGRTE